VASGFVDSHKVLVDAVHNDHALSHTRGDYEAGRVWVCGRVPDRSNR